MHQIAHFLDRSWKFNFQWPRLCICLGLIESLCQVVASRLVLATLQHVQICRSELYMTNLQTDALLKGFFALGFHDLSCLGSMCSAGFSPKGLKDTSGVCTLVENSAVQAFGSDDVCGRWSCTLCKSALYSMFQLEDAWLLMLCATTLTRLWFELKSLSLQALTADCPMSTNRAMVHLHT